MNEALKSISFQSINGGNWPRTVQWELNMWDQSQTHTHTKVAPVIQSGDYCVR